jgi:hypothetical protein
MLETTKALLLMYAETRPRIVSGAVEIDPTNYPFTVADALSWLSTHVKGGEVDAEQARKDLDELFAEGKLTRRTVNGTGVYQVAHSDQPADVHY